MRFQLLTTRRPKSVARQLVEEFAKCNLPLDQREAEDAAARLYGYRDLAHLSSMIGLADPSPDDSACDAETVADRRELQMFVISELINSKGVRLDHAWRMAARLIDLIRPTDCDPGEEPVWMAFEGGLITEHDGLVFWLQPVMGVVAVRAARFIHGEALMPERFSIDYGVERDEAAGKERVCGLIAERRQHARELERLGRRAIDWSDTDLDFTPWGEIDYELDGAEFYGDGLIAVRLGRYAGGFRVDPRLMAELPAVLRVPVDEEGYGWYERHGQSALVAIGLPRLFTVPERAHAREIAIKLYPEIVDILDGRIAATEANIRRAWGFAPEEEISDVFLALAEGETGFVDGFAANENGEEFFEDLPARVLH